MIKELEKTNANGNKTPSNHLQDRWVANNSDRELTSYESPLLCKGVNYAVSPNKVCAQILWSAEGSQTYMPI